MTAATTTPSPWVLAGSPTALGDPTSLVTLVDGQTFCLSSRSGDFDSNPAHGVYFADMRVLSRAHLRIGGLTIEPLAVLMGVFMTPFLVRTVGTVTMFVAATRAIARMGPAGAAGEDEESQASGEGAEVPQPARAVTQQIEGGKP